MTPMNRCSIWNCARNAVPRGNTTASLILAKRLSKFIANMQSECPSRAIKCKIWHHWRGISRNRSKRCGLPNASAGFPTGIPLPKSFFRDGSLVTGLAAGSRKVHWYNARNDLFGTYNTYHQISWRSAMYDVTSSHFQSLRSISIFLAPKYCPSEFLLSQLKFSARLRSSDRWHRVVWYTDINVSEVPVASVLSTEE
jgi:hypothetical protein